MLRSIAVSFAVTLFACAPPSTPGPDNLEPDAGSEYPVLPTARATKVVTGNGFACALVTNGSVRCWGWAGDVSEQASRRFSHFGTEQYDRAREPIEVPGITDVVDIDTDYQTVCVLTKAKTMKCWGDNRYGQVGNGTNDGVVVPYTVPLTNVKKIAVGGFHTCALLEDGTVKCWGEPDALEAITVTLQTDRYSPLDVPYAHGATDLFAWDNGTCVTLNGETRCFGGAKAAGADPYAGAAPRLLGVQGLVKAGVFARHFSCALVDDSAKCWGSPDDGWLGTGAQFGDPVSDDVQQVRGLDRGVTGLTLGGAVANGKVYRWGPGDLGTGVDSSLDRSLIPVEVPGISNATAIDAHDPVCVLTSTGSVYCWGEGENGQLGTGGRDRQNTPQKVHTFE